MTAISWRIVLSMLGSDFDNNYLSLPSVGASGGILIARRSCLGTVSASRVILFLHLFSSTLIIEAPGG
jgi:hypothetical protein